MTYSLIFTLLALFACFILVVLVIGSIRSSAGSGKYIILALFLSLFVYCFGYALELQNFPLDVTLRIIAFEYIGITMAPVLLLIFILGFYRSGGDNFWAFIPYLLIIPGITLIIVWSDLIIPWLYQDIWLNNSQILPGFAMVPGYWWYVITIWNSCLMITSLTILGRMFFFPTTLGRKQITMMIIGVLAPLSSLFLNLYFRSIIPIDVTPFMLVITGLAIYPGIMHYNLLNIVPVAYATIFSTLSSGIIVLDNTNRILDFNPVAEEIFNSSKAAVIGSDVRSLLTDVIHPESITKFLENRKEIKISRDGKSEYYLMDLKPFDDKDKVLAGSVLIITRITDRKEKEEQLLEYMGIIESRNNEIQEAYQEKVVLLREMHHRVKNNMQLISSLLSMQSRAIKDPTIQAIFTETQGRVRSLSLVHEQLYQSKNISKIDYYGYLRKITDYYLQSYAIPGRVVRCTINVINVEISIEKAVPLSLIISELLTNSLKYAFIDREKGGIIIDLSFDLKENTYFLDYQDDGKGIDPESKSDEDKGIGSTLIVGLVKQLSGTIKRDNSIPGVHYRIIFPGDRSSSLPDVGEL